MILYKSLQCKKNTLTWLNKRKPNDELTPIVFEISKRSVGNSFLSKKSIQNSLIVVFDYDIAMHQRQRTIHDIEKGETFCGQLHLRRSKHIF